MPCESIKINGEKCGKGNTDICKIHTTLLQRTGPNQTALNEIKYKHKNVIKQEEDRV
jgi:hypothetical protein